MGRNGAEEKHSESQNIIRNPINSIFRVYRGLPERLHWVRVAPRTSEDTVPRTDISQEACGARNWRESLRLDPPPPSYLKGPLYNLIPVVALFQSENSRRRSNNNKVRSEITVKYDDE